VCVCVNVCVCVCVCKCVCACVQGGREGALIVLTSATVAPVKSTATRISLSIDGEIHIVQSDTDTHRRRHTLNRPPLCFWRYLGPWVFVNTKVSVNIAYTGEEGSTQRGAQRCVQSVRTTSVGGSHTMSIQVAHGCADVRSSQTHRCLQTGVGPSYPSYSHSTTDWRSLADTLRPK
jgi:hypothetical protein